MQERTDEIFLPFFLTVIVINQQTYYGLLTGFTEQWDKSIPMKGKIMESVPKTFLLKRWDTVFKLPLDAPCHWVRRRRWSSTWFATGFSNKQLHQTHFKLGTALKYTCHPGCHIIRSHWVTSHSRGSQDCWVLCVSKYQRLFFSPVLLLYLGMFS